MDFIIDALPKSFNKIVILVVVDRFSKYVYFHTLSHSYIATLVAQVFFDTISRLQGMS